MSSCSTSNNDASPSLFEIGEIAIAQDLKKAKHLNGLLGEVVGAADATTGRFPVQFYEKEKRKLSTKSILPDNLKKLPNKDDPRIGYIRNVNGRSFEVPMRIENGLGKHCTVCDCGLDGKYYVTIQDTIDDEPVHYCEEHYVKTHVGDLLRFCAICHEFVPFMEGRALPTATIELLYPTGMLSDGTTRISFHGTFWAHDRCFRCSVCKKDVDDERIAPDGFTVRLDHDNQTAKFYCTSPAGRNVGCDLDHKKYSAAQERLEFIREMPTKEMKALLRKRNVTVPQHEDRAMLIRKIIVTETSGEKGEKQKHVVTTMDKTGKEKACKVVTGRAQPGVNFLDRSCKHGSQFAIQDTPRQSMLRVMVSDFFTRLSGSFSSDHLQSGKNYEVFPGVFFNPLDTSIMATVDYFTQADRHPILRSDMKERFIPKVLWAAAINGACREDGSGDYSRCALSGAVIASAILDMIEAKHPRVATDMDFMELFAPQFTPLKALVKDVTSSPTRMYQFIDSPNHPKIHRACDCMQYVATAAAMDALRLKPKRIKSVKIRCANCNVGLVEPRRCALCVKEAYCNEICQKQHWKVHKKACPGRKKNKATASAT